LLNENEQACGIWPVIDVIGCRHQRPVASIVHNVLETKQPASA